MEGFVPASIPFTAEELEAAIKMTPATLATRMSKGRWTPAKHLKYIALRIAIRLREGNARIIISTPPRHGKSELASTWTPIWALDYNPSWNIILTSYGAELSTGFSRKVRDRIIEDQESPSPLLRCKIRSDTRQVDEWRTTEDGGMFAVGIGGAMTGRGGNLLIVDDYLKNNIESESQSTRDTIWDWWGSTALTRVEPNGSVIIIATRWNKDDLTGRIIDSEGDDWEIINMPALEFTAEEAAKIEYYINLTGRTPGQALWPERYDEAALTKRMKALGTYWSSALFQQAPILRSAGMTSLEKLTTIDIYHYKGKCCRAWDLTASGEGNTGDYLVGAKVYTDDQEAMSVITDIIRMQPTPAQMDLALLGTAITDGVGVPIVIEQQPGAAGQVLKDHILVLLKGYTVHFIPPTGSKFVRASPFLSAVENGKVRMLKAFWNKVFKEELSLFDGDKNPHDDQVDAVALGFNFLHKRRFGGATWGRESTAQKLAAPTELSIPQQLAALVASEQPLGTGTDNVVQFPVTTQAATITSPVWGKD